MSVMKPLFIAGLALLTTGSLLAQEAAPLGQQLVDAKNQATGKPDPAHDPELLQYGIYQATAPRPATTAPVTTTLPLELKKGDRIAFIGNSLFDGMQDSGVFEALVQAAHPGLELVFRNLAWPADEVGLQPRPENFADTEQHLFHEKADVIFAAFGFNESFAGKEGAPEFRRQLTDYVAKLKTSAFNGETGPRVVLVSPIAPENVQNIHARTLTGENPGLYAQIMAEVAKEQEVGFANVFRGSKLPLTFNGVHLTEEGYRWFSAILFQEVFAKEPVAPNEAIRQAVLDKDRQYFRRFRPLNSFYYTGDRNKDYGYLDFLPAMRNFDIMVANRDRRIWDLAQGKPVPENVDDSNVPPLPPTKESRGANEWMTAANELKAFNIDPRFEVSLFAGEEQFPDIACPIQIRWDSRGRLWVSCSTTYPHVYPGNEPNDKLVILEDTDGDGRADKSSVFADDLHIPLSFEFGQGGVYVSDEPYLTFLKDTDGDGKADFRQKLLRGFGCEDSHHALHDFVWTPDGDLIFRESIFHHSQIETPYGPVRQNNSGWFRFEPKIHRLTSFGTYVSTNPWGVTFDDWGNHVASHPVFAAAFHALDPQYPEQHPKPTGLTAYSGTAGQEFIDFPFWPQEMQGGYIKNRYKPTNRVEFHRWKKTEFGYDEEYVGDIIFSTNLSFIPVDIQFGPRGDLFICDWYNPIKGHAQYSLRDPRRQRDSGRIWRIVPKGAKLQDPPEIADATIPELLELLKRPEYRVRYWAKRELRERPAPEVVAALNTWVSKLVPTDLRYRHHQVEAMWLYKGIDSPEPRLMKELLVCENEHARAAATQQLRYAQDSIESLRRSANDPSALVRMEAAIAASYIGTEDALLALLDTLKHPHDKHLSYAIRTSLGSRTLRPFWFGNEVFNASHPELRQFLDRFEQSQRPAAAKTRVNPQDTAFDKLPDVKEVKIGCVRERMLFDVVKFEAATGQPIRLEFTNPDATPHNLVIVKPGALEEIGIAGNEMAKDPDGYAKGFIPTSEKILVHTRMLDPEKSQTIRFKAPTEPGVYPYLCTFPGHWVIMKGEMVVK